MPQTTTYVLVHGAGSDAWYWHLLTAELRNRGHDVVAMDLPCDDDSAGLSDYVDTVVDAIGDRTGIVLVAQSLAGFTAPLVCTRVPVDLMVLVAAMIPAPGETGLEWWSNTGWEEPQGARLDDPAALFLHDVPPAVVEEAMRRGGRDQSRTSMREPWPLDAWPDVPTRFLLCRHDRFFPADWMRGVVKERLGITPDEIDAGHCPALSRPVELADRLEAYRKEAAMATPYTIAKLTDVTDSAPDLGLGDVQQTRFASADLETQSTGLTHHRFEPGARPDFAHRHQQAEEVYLVLSGSGRVKLDDEVLEIEPLDVIRVAPSVIRAWEAGPDGLDLLAFGPRHEGDGEVFDGWWTDSA